MTPYLNIETAAQRTIVVGDIHGCIDEVWDLLDLTGFSYSDILVAVGDMVDLGPDSWGGGKILSGCTQRL